MKHVWVEKMAQSVQHGGKTYGPSDSAVQVPEALAAALNLVPTHAPKGGAAAKEVNPLQEQLDEERTVGRRIGHALQQIGQILPLEPGTDLADGSVLRCVQELQARLRYVNEDVLPEAKRQQEADRTQVADLQAMLDSTQVADLQAMLDSTHEGNRQLGAVRDALQAELESTQSDFIKYQNDLPGLKARVAELEAGAAAEADGKPAAKPAKPAAK